MGDMLIQAGQSMKMAQPPQALPQQGGQMPSTMPPPQPQMPPQVPAMMSSQNPAREGLTAQYSRPLTAQMGMRDTTDPVKEFMDYVGLSRPSGPQFNYIKPNY